MNISANQIVQHIEEKLVSLKKGLANAEAATVKENAAAIEVYCQLLKSVSGGSKQEITQKLVTKTTFSSKENTEDRLGNLLDF
ncbi:YwdI family protein [bacterium LRH843]|nr:YwdI family protein [bacterium LRH843]